MSSIAREPGLAGEPRRWLDRILALDISIDLELLAFLALVGVAFVFHFWDLGSRAFHHDESLHATYSYYLYKGEGYKHDPLMHGPVLFHLTALMYLLFGVSNATARFSAAFAGTALVFTPYFLRRWIGRWGALSASALLIFSPTVLYYSRFLREDIFVTLWIMGIAIGVWRYLQERRNRWLYLAAACLALGFANKETTFMVAGIVLIYTDVLLASALSRPLAERYFGEEPSWLQRSAVFALLAPVAWAVAVLWHPLGRRRERLGLHELPASGDLLVVVGTLTLPQLSGLITIPFKHFGYTLPSASYIGEGPLTHTLLFGGLAQTIVVLLGASLIAGLAWDQRRWLISAAIFYGIWVCLYTTFFTNPDGIASGMWGSLTYWMAQQPVKRGAQPVFYYLMILPLYEYVALAFAAIGVIYQALRGGARSLLFLAGAIVLMLLIPAVYGGHNLLAAPLAIVAIALGVAAVRGDPLRQFLLLWFGAMLLALSVSGEKMPWLTVELILPLILLAGLGINDLFAPVLGRALVGVSRRLPAPGYRFALLLLLLMAVLGVAAIVPIAWGPGSDQSHVLLFGGALCLIGIVGIFAGFGWSPRMGAAMSGAALLGLLLPLMLRTTINLSFIHGDTPYTMLVYTQTTPELPKIMDDVQQYAQETGAGLNQPIIVDANNAFTWPWAWYLRDYHNVSYIDLSQYIKTNAQGQQTLTAQAASFRPAAGTILLLHDGDQLVVNQFRSQFGAGIPYPHRWWFPEDYKNGTTARAFTKSLAKSSTWGFWWGLAAGEHGIVLPSQPLLQGEHQIGSENAIAYFPAGYKPGVGIMASSVLGAAPKADLGGGVTVGTSGSAPGDFLRPAGVAVDSAGNFYVADSLNNRVEKFNSGGHLLATSDGSLNGQVPFHEPWGIAVSKQGMVYVADTWNHRIVELNATLQVVRTWGHPNPAGGPDGLLSFYGPRDIAFDASGNLLVTDTGNNRVLEFTPDGKPLGSFGTLGSGAGQFREPVGIAVAPDGTIYVADTWNGRVEVFNATKQYRRSLPLTGWESHSVENKPYLTVLDNGNLLLSQPDNDRLVEMTPAGAIVKNVSALGPNLPLSKPIGVAAGPSNTIVVADGSTNQVTREPLSALP